MVLLFVVVALTAQSPEAKPPAAPAPAAADVVIEDPETTVRQAIPEATPEAVPEAIPKAVPEAPIVGGTMVEDAGEAPRVPLATRPSRPGTKPSQAADLTPAFPAVAPVVITPQSNEDFFADDQLGHYLAWYGAEYVGVTVLAAAYLTGVHKTLRSAPALIGPQFDLDAPDLASLLDPRLDGVIGQPILKEKVPATALIVGSVTGIATLAAVDLIATGDLHRTHNLVLGGAEVLVGTTLVTEVLKVSFGRLRPDFRARYLSAACGGVVKAPDDLDCSGVDVSAGIDEEALLDGMKSFASGHSSNSFAMATFGALWLGTNLIVNDNRPDWGPAVGAFGIGVLGAGAGYVATTRLSDNRHHPEDVAVGAVIGTAIGASLYFVHFDTNGRARRRSFAVVPLGGLGASGTGQGVALAGTF